MLRVGNRRERGLLVLAYASNDSDHDIPYQREFASLQEEGPHRCIERYDRRSRPDNSTCSNDDDHSLHLRSVAHGFCVRWDGC